MALSVADFWKLAVESRLFSAAQVHSLQQAYAQEPDRQVDKDKPAEGCRDLARWLVARNALTAYQAKALAGGAPGPFFFADYQVIDRHENGPLAGALRARHLKTRYRVTLYFGDPGRWQDAPSAALAVASARRTSLGCEHLVQVYRFVELTPQPFVVLEDLAGGSLAERLATQPRPSVGAACRVAIQIAQAIAHLQGQGLAHGDVRPESIWFDAAGAARLLGFPFFGSKAEASSGRPAAAKADYLAPEVSSGAIPADGRSDIYSLGCTLYEMLAGRHPFAQVEQADKASQRLEQPPPLDRFCPSLPTALTKLVGYMMAKNPDLRFQQAARLAEALAAHAEPPPTVPADTTRRDAFEAWLREQQPALPTPAGPLVAAAPAPVLVPASSPAAGAPAASGLPAGLAPAPVAAAVPMTPAASPLGVAAPVRPAMAPGRRRGASRPQRAIVALSVAAAVLAIAVVAMLARGGKKDKAAENSTAAISSEGRLEGATGKPPSDDAAIQSTDKPRPDVQQVVVAAKGEPAASPENAGTGEPSVDNIASIGESIWRAPDGQGPIDLAYVPAGARVVIVLRAAELATHAEGEKLFDPRTSGGIGEWLTKTVPAIAGVPLDNLEEVKASIIDAGDGPPVWTYAFRLRSAVEPSELPAAWPGAQAAKLGETDIYRQGDTMYYLPVAAGGQTIVVAPATEMPGIVELAGAAPPLTRELEALAGAADRARTLTILAAPDFLANESAKLFTGPAATLANPLREFLEATDIEGRPQVPKALALCIDLREQLFVELRIANTNTNRGTSDVAKAYRQRLGELPDRVDAYVWDLAISPYSKPVLREFRKMLQAVDKQTRAGVDGKQVILRAWLPAQAAHNLALAAHLSLLERPGAAVAANPSQPPPELTVADKLAKKISLSFPRNTLEKSMELVSTEIGVPIEIVGTDLQLEGITKNQSFQIDERDQPAREILKKIMLKARPDGKLIYVVKSPAEGGPEMVFVTTRAAAASRGDKLPPEFAESEKPPQPK